MGYSLLPPALALIIWQAQASCWPGLQLQEGGEVRKVSTAGHLALRERVGSASCLQLRKEQKL